VGRDELSQHNYPNPAPCGTVIVVLITIIVAVGAAAAVVGGVIAGQRDPEPALIPIPVKRPRRSRDD
jgi:hypothetical protein